MKTTDRLLPTAGVSILLLAACSSDSDNNTDSPTYLDVNDLTSLQTDSSQLRKASSSELELTVKNGLFLNSYGHVVGEGNSCVNCFDNGLDVTSEAAPTADASAPTARRDFSGTTTQEEGVAESDRVKYNGDTMFIASNKADKGAQIRVLSRNPDHSLTEASTISLSDKDSFVDDMYLYQDKLTSIYQIYDYQDIARPNDNIAVIEPAVISDRLAIDIWYPYENKFGVSFHNAENPSQITENVSYEIDGYVLSSRRIEDKVYVVSSFAPNRYQPVTTVTDDTLQQTYETLVDSDETILPNITGNGASQPLVSADDCFLPQGSNNEDGYSSVVTLTTFSVNNPTEFNSICVVAPINGFYASTESIYFHTQVYPEYENGQYTTPPKTTIHQFNYTDDSVEYAASAQVEGHLGWSNPHLRFSEYQQHLRVITTDRYTSRDPEHKLYVLKANDNGELEQVSVLPNEQQPQAIGKPNEDIYAVRYFANKAYVVTFERIDPLYVIDLSDPTQPSIEGELEIPGYSAYLQPLGENFVLGIGQQIDANDIGLEPLTDTEFEEGAKAELYDISDKSNPQVVATLVFEDGYTPVEHDYHALTQLQVSDTEYKFAMPVYGWHRNVSDTGFSWQRFNTMQLMNVDISEGNPSMTLQGELEADSDSYSSWGDRAVLHGDVVYYLRDDQVWQSLWSSQDVVNGPY